MSTTNQTALPEIACLFPHPTSDPIHSSAHSKLREHQSINPKTHSQPQLAERVTRRSQQRRRSLGLAAR